jgi:hypothetical protein
MTSRRQFIIAGASAAALGVAGVGVGAAVYAQGWLDHDLRRLFGDFKMSDADRKALHQGFLNDLARRSEGRDHVLAIYRRPLVDGLLHTSGGYLALHHGPRTTRVLMWEYDRALATYFILGTDYVRRKDRDAIVTFVGRQEACGNPFANLALA